jgi:hypothetical protein
MLFCSTPLRAQPKELSLGVFELVNFARTNPSDFLVEYKDEMPPLCPGYISLLKNLEPLPPIIWDEKLVEMAKAYSKGQTNVSYQGYNNICSLIAGQVGYSWPRNKYFFYLSLFYSVIHQNAFTHLGFYTNDNTFIYVLGIECKADIVDFIYFDSKDTSFVDFESLNTAVNSSFLKDEEKAMIREINFLRKYPSVYASFIAQYMEDKSNSIRRLSHINLQEGTMLMDILKRTESLSILQPLECLHNAAKHHANDCKRRKVVSHTGSDGSTAFQRIKRYCKTKVNTGGENITRGELEKNVRGFVIQLLYSPPHRDIMLNSNWEYVACAPFITSHDTQGSEHKTKGWVQKFAAKK